VVYKCLFNGEELLLPVLCPGINSKYLLLFERILSHGYLIVGFLPIRITFPYLAVALLGTGHTVPDNLVCDYFLQSLSTFEANVIKKCIGYYRPHTFERRKTQLVIISTFSHFDCCLMPAPDTMQDLLKQAAFYHLIHKSLAAVSIIHVGIPEEHKEFWNDMSMEDLYEVYVALSASPLKLLQMIKELMCFNPAQECVFGYLHQFVVNLNADGIQCF